ncbi:MAG: STAS domain-containing protein [Phycisphaerae bacterium]|nr:STAS domain-containing protein [Phycisphaerae bacterium]
MSVNEWSSDIHIAELQDDPSFSEDMGSLIARFSDERIAKGPDVILDMRQVHFLNSSNISQLLRLRKAALSKNAHLRICSVTDRIWGVLLATDLDRVFDFSEDVTTALAAVQVERGTK